MRIARVIGIVVLALVVLIAVAGFVISPALTGIPLYAASRSAAFQPVTSSVDSFKYQPDRIQVGQVYHYIKSNIDGSNAAQVSLYVAAPDYIEVFKVYPDSATTTLVTAKIDWSQFSPSGMQSFDIHPDHSRTLVIEGQLASGDQYNFHVAQLLWVKDKETAAPIGHYPVHNYNFDLASLNFAFRHLVDPTRPFEVGIQMPRFDVVHLGEMEYLGKATIRYLGEEACHANQCRKYSIGGEAFGGRQGYLWVNKDQGYFEKVEIPVRDNPSWKDFKLELTGTESMSTGQWQKYIDNQTDAYFAKAR